jgi:hypothetical protein
LAEAARRLAHQQPSDTTGVTTAGAFRADSARKPPGRPAKPGSYRDVARRTGIPVSTIRDAERHVNAAARYAALQAPDIPQAEAIALAKTLDRLPAEARAETLEAWRARRPGLPAALGGKPLLPPGPSAEEAMRAWAIADPLQGWPRVARQLGVFVSRVEAAGGLAAVTRAWRPDRREALLADMDQAIAQLARLRTALRRLIDV